jgi:hypothetical protein
VGQHDFGGAKTACKTSETRFALALKANGLRLNLKPSAQGFGIGDFFGGLEVLLLEFGNLRVEVGFDRSKSIFAVLRTGIANSEIIDNFRAKRV